MTDTLQTGHIGLNVTDLHRSQEFYQKALGLEILRQSDEAGREFAFLGANGKLILTLWQQSQGTFDTTSPGLHHLSFQVDTIEDVRAAEGRLRALGAHFFHQGIVPHAEGAQSGGIFFADPDGTRLEIYAPTGADEQAAPTPDGPTCGFF